MSGSSGSSPLTLPFNLQAAISSRCTFILRQLQHFLYFHQIENFGCDFATTGLLKDKYIYRLSEFFLRRKRSDEPYDTYLLYYCGPTSQQSDNLSFIDGAELGIDEIVALWKETNLKKVRISRIFIDTFKTSVKSALKFWLTKPRQNFVWESMKVRIFRRH